LPSFDEPRGVGANAASLMQNFRGVRTHLR
jgi:hypothetical protein